LTLDNLVGLGEMLTATHRESIPLSNKEHYSASDDFNLSLPYGYNTFSLDVNRSRYINVLSCPAARNKRQKAITRSVPSAGTVSPIVTRCRA
jgi:hemolysin activation/secretion protein